MPSANRANPFSLRVNVQADVLAAGCREEPVFDHPRCRADQSQCVRMPGAFLSGYVQNAQQLSSCRDDRRCCTGEKAVALQKVLGAVDFDGRKLCQSGPDGVGASVVFVPRGPAAERDALCLAQEVGIPQGVHQGALLVGQNDHVLVVPDLIKQVFHDRAGMGQQLMVACESLGQPASCAVFSGRYPPGGQQSCRQAAVPRTRQTLVNGPTGALAVSKQVSPGMAQGDGG